MTNPEILATNAATKLLPEDISGEVLLEKYAKGCQRTIADVRMRVIRALTAITHDECKKLRELPPLLLLRLMLLLGYGGRLRSRRYYAGNSFETLTLLNFLRPCVRAPPFIS